MSDRDEEESKVGYGRPPVHSRFKPGQSGNPRGRPRGRRSMESMVREVLGEKMFVTLNGRRRRVSMEMAILLRQREQALKGDLRAAKLLLDMRRGYLEDQGAGTSGDQLSQEDRAILESIGFMRSPEANDELA